MLSEADKRIIRRDESVSGLQLLLDSHALQEQLSRLPDLASPEQLEIDYLRYKPGENCVARVLIKNGGKRIFGYAKAYGQNAGAKLGKAAERPDLGSALGRGRLQLPRYGLEVNFLPNDNALDSVGRLADRQAREALLRRVFKNQSYRPGGSYLVLNYKPERRLALSYAHGDGRRSVVKFSTPARFRGSRAFYKKLKPVEGILLPVLAGGSKAHHALAFDWRNGVTPDEQLRSGESRSIALVGDALARFHGCRQPGLRSMDPVGEGRRVTALARDLEFLSPNRASAAADMAKVMKQWLEAFTAARAVPLHGDFYAEQAVVGDGEVALIDCDRACLGHPGFDLGSFVARMEFDVLSGVLIRQVAESARESLLDGYGAHSGAVPEGMDKFVAHGLFLLLHHPFRQRLPDWPEVTRSVIDRCQELWHGGSRV